MAGWETWAAFLGYAVPMIISPGPGNTLLATAGGRHGVGGSVPFWAGFEAANLALCLTYGLGLGGALHEHPEIHTALKWAGVVYLLYLAWGFFRASAKPANQAAGGKRLGFIDGFICVIFNPKIHSMIAVMFAQFLAPNANLSSQVGQLSAAFVVLGLFCHFPWIYGGKVILGRFESPRALRIQAAVFGTSMLLVALYVVLN
ncbi:Homoserine/homoserine lactone efflux protein [Achromobacter xylosoxidans]|uniref:LysE family translocator n=2 Tax=Alcaligenes xylosoxydans xylosoxydans TaxID=85698 RepID=UPI0006C580E4|nr:LysE family translocator [Achromobacter xylosoxidans]CUJ20111.1 Homoserine/homoserine lactone efflux protein [Achromobacter xylosoxidans]